MQTIINKENTGFYTTSIEQMFLFLCVQEVIEIERCITCLNMNNKDIDLFFEFLKYLQKEKIVYVNDNILTIDIKAINSIKKLNLQQYNIKYLG